MQGNQIIRMIFFQLYPLTLIFFSNVEVLDLNIEFYNYLNDFRIYDSIVRIFGYYYTKKACDSNLKMNCYRYESFPCINLFLYLLNEIEGADDEYLLFLKNLLT